VRERGLYLVKPAGQKKAQTVFHEEAVKAFTICEGHGSIPWRASPAEVEIIDNPPQRVHSRPAGGACFLLREMREKTGRPGHSQTRVHRTGQGRRDNINSDEKMESVRKFLSLPRFSDGQRSGLRKHKR
jgi:hypothetical protein